MSFKLGNLVIFSKPYGYAPEWKRTVSKSVFNSWERFCGFHSGWERLTRKYYTWPLAGTCYKIQSLLYGLSRALFIIVIWFGLLPVFSLTEAFLPWKKLHRLKVPCVSDYKLYNLANITGKEKKKKAQEASKIYSSRWHFHQLPAPVFHEGKRGIYPLLSNARK